jgi:HemY protein
MFMFGAVAAFAVGYLLVRLVLAAVNLPQYVRSFRAERAQGKGRTAMLEALTAFFEGRYAAAEKAAVRAMELGESSGLNSIIAARAANELRDFDRRDAYLAEAQGKTVGEETMRLMAKAEFKLDQKQPQSALSVLKELNDTGIRKHIGALNLELKAQQQARNWDAVLDVANQLEKRNAINASMATQMRQQAWLEKLRACAHDGELLRSVWKSMPTEFKQRSKIAGEAASLFMQLRECSMARNLLTESLNAEWDGELVALYGDCMEGSVIAQIEQAERWLNEHHDDAGLLLALGKLCLHQELWGKAQNYLDASLSLHPSREAYSRLAQLAEKLHKPDEALKYEQLAAKLHGPA